MKKLRLAIFGIGRIGKVHLKNIIKHRKCNLLYIYDTDYNKRKKLCKKHNVKFVEDIQEIFDDKTVDAVFISSPTNTHLDLIVKAIKSNKQIFSEKPIDLDLKKINKLKNKCNNYKKTFQIGFNRRFDKSIDELITKVKKNKVGNIEKIIITSRDKSPPPSIKYLKESGGILRDCAIHDIDLLINILQNDSIEEVFCYPSILFDKRVKKLGDHDTIMSLFKTKKGKIAMINNSRRSIYGYDQRIEVFGSKGMIMTKNINENSTLYYSKNNTAAEKPHLNFFLERYEKSFIDQLDNFIENCLKNRKASVTFEDCRKSLEICEKLYISAKNGKSVKL